MRHFQPAAPFFGLQAQRPVEFFRSFFISILASYLLRLPRSMKAGIEHVSKRYGCSFNQFVTMAVAEKLAALNAEDCFRSRVARRTYLLACRVK